MQLGLFCLMPRREPSTPVREIYDDTVTLVRTAEEIGFDTAWFAEHHFSNYCMCPSPLMMAAYCAPLTTRIRLAPAVLVLPLYNPVRLLEEIGMVDNLSGGRLVIGIGAGYQDYEFARFNQKIEENWAVTHEMLDILELGLTRESFAYDGQHFHLPELPIGVRTVQQPMPPVYVAGAEPRMVERAAKRGYTMFATVGFKAIEAMADVRTHIDRIYAAQGWRQEDVPFAAQRYIYVTDRRDDALDAAERILYTTRIALSLRFKYERLNGTTLEPLPFQDEPTPEQIVDNVIIGDPETCAEKLAREIGVVRPTHLSCFMQFGGMDGRRALRSLERFGAEVLPLLERELGAGARPALRAAAAAGD